MPSRWRIRTHYGSSNTQNLNYGYSYDVLSRLTGVSLSSGDHTLLYDANGNREFHTWARSYTHDAAGNRLSETVAGNTIDYGYDGLNRLVRRQQPQMTVCQSHGACPTLPAGTWGYTHDGLGRRTSKVQLDGQGAPIASTRVRYVYGPEGLLHAETTPGSTTLTSVYIWLNGEPIGLIRNNTLYHVHSDHLGRPEVITDASRNVVWRAAHFPWDRTVATSSIGAYNLGFPGQYRDSESAQWYNYFRTYDGSTGRYTQADPIGLAGGMNLYLYANANPVSWIDPNGLQASCPTFEQCVARCIEWNYGEFYHVAAALNPITALSAGYELISHELNAAGRQSYASNVNRSNSFGHSQPAAYNAGQRMRTTLSQFGRINQALLVAGGSALVMQGAANTYCMVKCL